MTPRDLTPGAFVEVLEALMPPLPGTKKKDPKEPRWRPAVFSHQRWDGVLVFRWTDNRHFTRLSSGNLRTLVRKPTFGTLSQEWYVHYYGELC